MDASQTDGIFAGSLDGRRVFADLVGRTVVPSAPEVCFLDFGDVAVATASFLRDSIIAYRNHARSNWPTLYPVAANMAERVREEFESWLLDRNDAFVVCKLDAESRPSSVGVLGAIDGKQRITLSGVVDLGETDAPSLARHIGEDVSPTAWNNRLNALVDKGLIMELTGGRNKRYRPTLEGLTHHGT